MSKLKLASIILISVFLGVGITLTGFWFLSGKLFSPWMAKTAPVNQQNNTQVTDCSFPTSTDMALLDKHETVKQTSLKCTAFTEAKLQYNFDPKNALTWDNAFPSREDWVRRLKVFKEVSKGYSTYILDKYDLAFNYPAGWNVFVSTPGHYWPNEYQIILSNPGDQLVRPMVIKIQDYSASSDVANEWVPGLSGSVVLTKAGLLQKKKQIESSARTADNYGKFVTLGNDYSTFEYHNFYRHGEFFIGNNLITVIQPLSVVAPDIAGYGKEQEKLLSKINNGSVDELVSAEVKLVDFVVYSFRIASLDPRYPGDY